MKKILFIALLIFLPQIADAALSVNSVYEVNASATGSNVNAGGFNPSNANMMTDLSATSATGNDAVASSSVYTFVAGDVGHWLYIKSGTGWFPGWYKIASVTSGKATLDSAAGEPVWVNTSQGMPAPRYMSTTTAGVANTASPTGGTFTIDYSQGTAAILAITDGVSTASTNFTSVAGGFTKAMIGNYLHLNSATGADEVVGWYEIVNQTDGNTIVLDRVSGTYTLAVAKIGGAMSLNSTLDDDFFEIMLATNGTGSNRIFTNGAFTTGEAVSIAAAGGTQAPIVIEGYNTLRGDMPTGTSRPSINCVANVFTLGSNWDMYHVESTGSSSSGVTAGSNSKLVNVKSTNTSTTAARSAFTSGIDAYFSNVEAISYRGYGISLNNNAGARVLNSYIHDSNIGLRLVNAVVGVVVTNNIIASNVTTAIAVESAFTSRLEIAHNTLYGSENTTGTGVSMVTGVTDTSLTNNIISGFVTGVSHADTQTVGFDDYNDYYNNDTNATNWNMGSNDVTANPTFTNVTQITGTGNYDGTLTITDTDSDFSSVVDDVDFVRITGGTGVTQGIYGIDSHTATTLVLDIDAGASNSDTTFELTLGDNFAVGTGVKALGFPGLFPGGLTTGYMDIGAVQRVEPVAGGGGSCAPIPSINMCR